MSAALSPEASPSAAEDISADDERESGIEVLGAVRSAPSHPPPDFRYVALEPYRARTLVASVLGAAGAACGLGLALGHHARAAGLVVSGAALLWLGLRARRGEGGARAPSIALVPWGLLVESEVAPRALSWASVRAVRVVSAHGRDGGNTTTVASFVTVETLDATYLGRTPGEANLERLEAHLAAYTHEQSRPVALDLDGAVACAPVDGDAAARLVASARAWLASAEAHDRLGLDAATYRTASARAATPRAVATLASVLHDLPHDLPADPRAFAAIVAAELGARELVDDLLALVQSPHPLVAAFAKQAARRLGASTARAGSIDEVCPFLGVGDEPALHRWAPPDVEPADVLNVPKLK